MNTSKNVLTGVRGDISVMPVPRKSCKNNGEIDKSMY